MFATQDIKCKIKIIAVMNDTTACLAYGAYSDYDAMIGAVIGELAVTPILWHLIISMPRLRRLNR